MAQVHVRYFGMLHQLVNKRDERVRIEDSASVSDLIQKITKLHGRKLEDYVFASKGHLKEGFAYAVNGNSVSESELSQIKCKSVTEFVILPPISGGI